MIHVCFTWLQWVNSLWPSDAIWCQKSGSTLFRVMACCQMASRNYLYLSLCWLIFNRVFCICMTTILQELFNISIDKLILKLTFLQLQPKLSGDNESMCVVTTKLSNRFLLLHTCSTHMNLFLINNQCYGEKYNLLFKPKDTFALMSSYVSVTKLISYLSKYQHKSQD